MKKFHKQTKSAFRFIKAIVIFTSLVCLTSCGGSIIPNNSIATYTKDELNDLYWENKDELNEVAKIILANEELYRQIIENNDVERDVWGKSQKKLFSNEEWGKIVDLYKKIRPYTIERRRNGAIYIDFAQRKVGGSNISTSLYYFGSEETANAYRVSRFETLEHLEGYWYINEWIFDR